MAEVKKVKSVPAAPSFARTIIPIAVGQIVSWAAMVGVEVPEDVENALGVLLGFVVAVAYYVVIRFVEQKFPKVGVLLGWAATPDGYTSAKAKGVVGSAVVDRDPRH